LNFLRTSRILEDLGALSKFNADFQEENFLKANQQHFP